MISTVYIAFATQRLDFQLDLIRHCLFQLPSNKDIRDAFIQDRTKRYANGFAQYINRKTDKDIVDELILGAIPGGFSVGYRKWLQRNLNHLWEFSENRLKQMELILRYSLFESFLLKIIGNILWEYPDRRRRSIHQKMEKGKLIRWKKRKNSLEEQIAWTKAVVNAVDRLPFAQWDEEETDKIYLWQYLRDGLELEFGQEKLCSAIEKARRIRNYIVHRSMEVPILETRTTQTKNHFAMFPVLLAQAASTVYPKACTEEPPDEDDDGTPGYVLMEKLVM